MRPLVYQLYLALFSLFKNKIALVYIHLILVNNVIDNRFSPIFGEVKAILNVN